MTEYNKKRLILEYLYNNGAKGESFDKYSNLKTYIEQKKDFPIEHLPMTVNFLIKKDFIKLFESQKEVIYGTEQIKLDYLGKIYVESRKYYLTQFFYWCNKNDFSHGWKLISSISGFGIGWLAGAYDIFQKIFCYLHSL